MQPSTGIEFSYEDLKSFWMFGFKILSPKFPKIADLGKEGLQAALKKYKFRQQGVCISPLVSQ